jgi:hypothetical protein
MKHQDHDWNLELALDAWEGPESQAGAEDSVEEDVALVNDVDPHAGIIAETWYHRPSILNPKPSTFNLQP